ncbi:MAG: ankyrin repeat domain-containing protein [Chitinophagaceae bacterium]
MFTDAALRWAINSDNIEMVKVLLAAGADVHARDDEVFRWAAHNDNKEILKLLKEAGANTD